MRVRLTLAGIAAGAAFLAGPGAVLVSAPAARAQGMVGRLGAFGAVPGHTARISPRSLEKYCALLGLDEGQTEAARSLHEGYERAFDEAVDEAKRLREEAEKKAREANDWIPYMRDSPGVMRAAADKVRAVETGFFDDLRALLTPEQEEKWNSLERLRRRETGLRIGFYSGASVDLALVLERSRAPMTPEVRAALGAWEEEIDGRILAIESVAQRLEDEVTRDGVMAQMGRELDHLDKIGDVARTMRDVNRRHARAIADALPEEQRSAFEGIVRQRTHPRVWAKSETDQMLESAAKLPDLDERQRQDLEALVAQHAQRAAALKDAHARAIDAAEEAANGTLRLELMSRSDERIRKLRDEVRAARRARRDLDRESLERLGGVLTQAQVEKLPKPARRDDEGFSGPFYIQPLDDE
ncbi:MAG TPA: hypothetical protein VD971_05680 [Phycisphaerales bacterium]|nr:hypothetical protein [Phycisphaerales bacterium]